MKSETIWTCNAPALSKLLQLCATWNYNKHPSPFKNKPPTPAQLVKRESLLLLKVICRLTYYYYHIKDVKELTRASLKLHRTVNLFLTSLVGFWYDFILWQMWTHVHHRWFIRFIRSASKSHQVRELVNGQTGGRTCCRRRHKLFLVSTPNPCISII